MQDYYSNDVIDVEDIKIDNYSFILIASRRRSGKSVLVKGLIKNICDNFEIDFIILFSKTAEYNNEYDFIEKKYRYDYEKCEQVIEKIINYQKQKIKRNKETTPNIIIILDDIILHKKNKKLIDVSSLGRHFKIFCIASVQFPKQVISTSIRSNLDIVFWNDLSDTGLEAIYQSIHLPYSYKEFKTYTYTNNDNYQFLCYNNNEKNKNKRVTICKAKMYESLHFE